MSERKEHTHDKRSDERAIMTAIDDGLPAAVARVKVASDEAHVVRDFDGPRVTCRCGATLRTDDGTWYDHRLEAVARAAREDVAETVREARAAELDAFSADFGSNWIGGPGAKSAVLRRLRVRAAAIRAGGQ